MGLFSRWAKPKQETCLDWQAFVNLFAERIAALSDAPELQIDWGDSIAETLLNLRLSDERELSCYLGNHYQRYLQSPEDLEDIVQIVLNSIAEVRQESPARAEQIMPVIRSHEWLASIAAAQSAPLEEVKKRFFIRTIAGDLLLAYALDMASGMQILTAEHAAEMALDIEQVHEIAKQNFLRYAQDSELSCAKAETQEIYQALLDDNYDSSLLLFFSDVLAGAGLNANAAYIFAIPERQSLLFCPAENAAAIAALREMTQEMYANAAYPVSAVLYHYQQGEVRLHQTLQ